jgi:uncharacterized protein YbgA (DUF1722 family)/uncharacterized protein YbbK (DUF523 family)
MDTKIKAGISACLLGQKVRYDGQDKLDHYLRDTAGRFFEWLPVCPEVECGLPVPREAMRLVGAAESPRLDELGREDLCGFVFKGKSPSSGYLTAKIYSEDGVPYAKGSGLFAAAFTKRFPLIPAEDDCRMRDPDIRENFIERVFVFHRWKEFIRGGGGAAGLVEFHTRHKLMIMSRSPADLYKLGRIVASAGKSRGPALTDSYISALTEILKKKSSVKKHVNVMDHAAGYFKKQLDSDGKKELREIIENYRQGLLPVLAPLTLFNHYIREYKQDYLASQYYFNPHPLELRLRNSP